MTFNGKCKICKSDICDTINMCRFYLRWPYPVFIEVFGEHIDNLNGYNLSSHSNHHVDSDVMKFWRNLHDAIDIYKLGSRESEAIFQHA